jgi:hypothetical protein
MKRPVMILVAMLLDVTAIPSVAVTVMVVVVVVIAAAFAAELRLLMKMMIKDD